LKPLSHHKAKKDSISIRSNQDQVCQKAESSSWLNKDRLAGLREEPLKRPHSIIVAMAATETLRGGPSISYSSIVFSMGILLWFKNDCPSTCRPTQNTTRTHKEDIKMCCVMYMCVKTNTYAHLFAYTNIQMHGTLLLSTVSGPFASFLSLTFLFALLALFSCPTSLVLSASRFISLNSYDCHTFTYLVLITPPLSGDEFTGSKFLVSSAPFFRLVTLWYDSLYFSLLLA